jgi:hypothetical protein
MCQQPDPVFIELQWCQFAPRRFEGRAKGDLQVDNSIGSFVQRIEQFGLS